MDDFWAFLNMSEGKLFKIGCWFMLHWSFVSPDRQSCSTFLNVFPGCMQCPPAILLLLVLHEVLLWWWLPLCSTVRCFVVFYRDQWCLSLIILSPQFHKTKFISIFRVDFWGWKSSILAAWWTFTGWALFCLVQDMMSF